PKRTKAGLVKKSFLRRDLCERNARNSDEDEGQQCVPYCYCHNNLLFASETPIKKFHDNVVAVAGFWHVGIVEEPMKQAVPYVQFRFDSVLHKLIVLLLKPCDRHCRQHASSGAPVDADVLWSMI